MGRLDGKIALITGAGRGVGYGIAMAMAKEGADIAIVEIDSETAGKTKSEVERLGRRSHAVVADIATREACETSVAACVEALGGLDVLVNNAAVAPQIAPIVEMQDEPFRRTVDVCMMATFWCMQAAHPHLLARGGGSIINFGSGAATSGMVNQIAYAAAKEGIRGMTRVAANEWGPQGIRVNTICPLATSEAMVGWAKDQPGLLARYEAKIPLQRIGDCEDDIGRAVVFLASEDAHYVTGNTMFLDGGYGSTRA
ncbi:MAG: SDR family oxidoreductase [Candidatus Binatia bacterium]|nr:SDR family oxidoreductase [Candidatus Binatia bacterium]